jgi:hypothetical protein
MTAAPLPHLPSDWNSGHANVLARLVNRRMHDDEEMTDEEIKMADALIEALHPVVAAMSKLVKALEPWIGEQRKRQGLEPM